MAKRVIRIGKRKLTVDPQRVRVAGTALDSLGWLEQVPEVEELELANNRLRSLADLPALPRLRQLHVRNNPIGDLRGVERPPALAELSVWGTPLRRPHAVAGAKRLAVLSLAIATRDLAFLGGHRRLGYLAVSGALRSLRGFERCPALGELVVHGAALSGKLTIASRVLWKLFLESCRLSRVPDLATPKLLILGLQANPFTHLDRLAHLPKLRDLMLDGRKIKTIDAATDAMLRQRGITVRGLRAKIS